MRINNNLMAMNTHRQLGMGQANGAKSMEKLSSGYRINRAGDDAAGLSISEKMRGQIRGLNQASRNAQDGISMIQTAEGALSETQAILQRMRELAVQSANDTNVSLDRGAIQNEITQLKSEIDRIGNTTEFNTQKLLNGNLASVAGATAGDNVTISGNVLKETAAKLTQGAAFNGAVSDMTKTDTLNIDGMTLTIDWSKMSETDKTLLKADNSAADATTVGKIRDAIVGHINTSIDEFNASTGNSVQHVTGTYDGAAKKLTLISGSEGNNSKISMTPGDAASVFGNYFGGGATTAIAQASGGRNDIMETVPAETLQFEINGATFKTGALTTAASGTDAKTVATNIQTLMNAKIDAYNTNAGLTKGQDGYIQNVTVEAKDGRFNIASPSGNVSFKEQDGGTAVGVLGLDATSSSSTGAGAVTLQIGANKGQTMNFGINDMRTNALGVTNVNVSTSAGAQKGIETFDKALTKVSEERAKLGAIQNRLEHSIKNLDTSAENLQASESRIRDVDMAKEMMEFTKNNILTQAAQAMLAQANQAPQGVLQLLR